ncbi:MAG: hypothetical protein EOP06_18355 [Proteobacteria bacterium]|nr:MAG: hypothetical protein EOP06_18355 [Pseudomonadota bacterium]
MKKLALIMVFPVCVSIFYPNCADAHTKERYVLRSHRIKVKADPNKFVPSSWDEWDLSLWDSRKKRVVWKQHLGAGTDFEANSVHWSKDRRALVFDDTTRFMVWREGHRVRWFASPSDYVMKFAWSPDNHRLLVMSGGSGASDLGCGGIYCFKLQNPPRYKYVHLGSGCGIGWKSPRVALIWNRFGNYGQPNFVNLKPPVSWRVP